jgi:hypothetical protein
MTIAETKSDQRHYNEVEEKLAVKSSLILCFPIFVHDTEVYGALQVSDTSPEKKPVESRYGISKAAAESCGYIQCLEQCYFIFK